MKAWSESASALFLFFCPLTPLAGTAAAAVAERAAAVAGRRLPRSGVSFARGKVSCVIVGMSRMLKFELLSAFSRGFSSNAGFLQHQPVPFIRACITSMRGNRALLVTHIAMPRTCMVHDDHVHSMTLH